jgi:beta-mannanase
MDAFAVAAGRRPSVSMWFQGWAGSDGAFDAAAADRVSARGAIPMITWEPWAPGAGVNQSSYRLAAIAAGRYDTYVRTWAKAAAAWGKPMFVRFAHEMNGPYYPWSEQSNGNRPGDYVRAWRHVHDVLRDAGATNVSWVWCPNLEYAGTTALAGLYPGSSYVDWTGVDAYNGGTALPWGGWLSFGSLVTPTLDKISGIAPTKPQLVGEVASVEQGGSKAAWIQDMFSQLARRPQVRAVIWFNHAKEADWRIQSSATAQAAFAAGAASTRFR